MGGALSIISFVLNRLLKVGKIRKFGRLACDRAGSIKNGEDSDGIIDRSIKSSGSSIAAVASARDELVKKFEKRLEEQQLLQDGRLVLKSCSNISIKSEKAFARCYNEVTKEESMQIARQLAEELMFKDSELKIFVKKLFVGLTPEEKEKKRDRDFFLSRFRMSLSLGQQKDVIRLNNRSCSPIKESPNWIIKNRDGTIMIAQSKPGFYSIAYGIHDLGLVSENESYLTMSDDQQTALDEFITYRAMTCIQSECPELFPSVTNVDHTLGEQASSR